SGSTGVHSSITLAGADTPYISYQDSANSEVLLAHRDGANWSSELVAGRGNFAGDTNVVVAPNNTIEVSYFDRAQRAIMYAAKGASGWATMRVDSGFSEGFNRLALNPLGNPCLVYTGFDGSLRYAAWNGAEWSIDVVDQTTVTSRYADLVFDGLGRGTRRRTRRRGRGPELRNRSTGPGANRVLFADRGRLAVRHQGGSSMDPRDRRHRRGLRMVHRNRNRLARPAAHLIL